jgi:putative tricarboxylic transport membrane protein
MVRGMRRAEVVSSVVILGICGYFWAVARDFERLGRLFPRVIIIILTVLALFLLGSALLNREKNEKKVFGDAGVKYLNILLCIVLFTAWAVFIHLLGFVVTSVVFFSIITILFDTKKRTFAQYLLRIVTVAVTVGVFYLFFALIMLVPFPRGVLF